MTLQQKLLAKQSKKGFTLVELVVVIAILAILAAIAIPAVIGIINSASSSAGESDAATLNSGCKTVYSGVKSGTITNADKDAGGNKITWATEKGASATKRTDAAGKVTIKQVQEYNGTAIALDDMYYQEKTDTAKSITAGTIVFSDAGTPPTGTKQVTDGLKMSELYIDLLAKWVSLAGTCMGIGLGLTPIIPFINIIKGKEDVRTFPESLIFINIFCPHLWCTYWIRQAVFIPFFSAIFGLVLGLVFATIYLYFYLHKSTLKWLLSQVAQYTIFASFHYALLYIVPKYQYIGFTAMVSGIITSMTPAQNVVVVFKKGDYKLIPIWTCIFGGLCAGCWLVFGILLKDVYNIIPNALSLLIQICNVTIYFYFYTTRNKRKEVKEEEEKLQDGDDEH